MTNINIATAIKMNTMPPDANRLPNGLGFCEDCPQSDIPLPDKLSPATNS